MKTGNEREKGIKQACNSALFTSEDKETLIYWFLHFRAEDIFWVLLAQLAVTGEAG